MTCYGEVVMEGLNLLMREDDRIPEELHLPFLGSSEADRSSLGGREIGSSLRKLESDLTLKF